MRTTLTKAALWMALALPLAAHPGADPGPEDPLQIELRAWRRLEGPPLALKVRVLDAAGQLVAELRTLEEPAVVLRLTPGVEYRLEAEWAGKLRTRSLLLTEASPSTLDLHWDQLGMTQAAAQELIESLSAERARELAYERVEEFEAESFVLGDQRLRLLQRSFGEAPPEGHSLWISLHGGGGAPEELNDGQWRNQIGLYEPEEGLYIAPRAPTNSWNLWHQAHIDALLERLIDSYVALAGVNPNRVYLLGYSAGGDGVYQLAPRMADRFAAACMMAGHPNEAQPLGLRNLPFGLFVGAEDAAYDRNRIAGSWNEKLEALQALDPGGYEHLYRSYAGLGHWMEKRDAEGLPWMASKVRDPWPKRVVWYQDDVLHESSYWLQCLPGQAAKGQLLIARVDGQRIELEAQGLAGAVLRLHDRLLDLDREISVQMGEREVFRGRVARTEQDVRASIRARLDPSWAASASLTLEW